MGKVGALISIGDKAPCTPGTHWVSDILGTCALLTYPPSGSNLPDITT